MLKPLWAYAEVNPVTRKFQTLDEGSEVTFLPLEAVWPSGRADFTRSRPWIKKESYTQFERGDILVPKITPTFEAGRACIADIPTEVGLASTEVHVLRAGPETEPRWLCYTMQSAPFLDFGAHNLQGVGNLRRITPQFLSSFPLAETPLPSQRAIADYLDRETAQIDAMAAELDGLARLLAERKVAAHAAIIPEELPPSWLTRSLSTMFVREKITGLIDEPMVSVFRDHGVVFKDAFANLNVTAEDRSIYQLVDDGWFVVNRMKSWQGSVGVSRIRGISSGHYLCFRPTHEEDHDFLNALFRSPPYTDWFARYSRGVRPGQAEIDNAYLISMPVVVPPLDEQRRIVEHLGEVTAEIDSMISDAQELKALLAERRSALITEVVTGSKEVPVS